MELTDESLMPWGVHKNKTMANVPADYLLWCYDNKKCSSEVKKYIEDNMEVLKVEKERILKNIIRK